MYFSKIYFCQDYLLQPCCPLFLSQPISYSGKMYSSQLQNVFVSIAKCICLNCKMYLSQLPNIFLSRFSPPAVLPCFPFPTNYIYNFILRQNPFVSIKKYICLNCKMYLSQLQNKFVSIAKRICLNCICLNC